MKWCQQQLISPTMLSKTGETIFSFDRALIVDQLWIPMLLAGSKPWEMRSHSTKIKGRI